MNGLSDELSRSKIIQERVFIKFLIGALISGRKVVQTRKKYLIKSYIILKPVHSSFKLRI